MVEIAAAAGVGRSTLYRHFPTREALDHALELQMAHQAAHHLEAEAPDAVNAVLQELKLASKAVQR